MNLDSVNKIISLGLLLLHKEKAISVFVLVRLIFFPPVAFIKMKPVFVVLFSVMMVTVGGHIYSC